MPGSADGTGSAARFTSPSEVAVDRANTLYVAYTGNHTIRRMTPAGVVSTVAGSPGVPGSADGTGAAARFNSPIGASFDGAGNLYVGDSDNDTIRKITPAAVVTTLAGKAGEVGSADGTGSNARFSGPRGVAVNAAGDVYVADTFNNTIRKSRLRVS
jgi:sugar lactone lactonase YvrE